MNPQDAFFNANANQQIQLNQTDLSKSFKMQDTSDQYGYGDAFGTILSNTASMAGTGAMSGAFIGGPVGGVIGGIAGATVGLGLGIWDAYKGNSEDDKRIKAAGEYNAEQESLRLVAEQQNKSKNDMMIQSWEANAQKNNLQNYKAAVSAPAYQTIQ